MRKYSRSRALSNVQTREVGVARVYQGMPGAAIFYISVLGREEPGVADGKEAWRLAVLRSRSQGCKLNGQAGGTKEGRSLRLMGPYRIY